tara:strand:- start:4 stop:321 length:318 start_codon:yes stop_codon:yes gene_type:complete
MENKFSKKKYNRNSITVTTDSVYTSDAFDKLIYNEKATELIHDSLQILLHSPNPLREEYILDENDFEYIANLRAQQRSLLDNMSMFLKTRKEIIEEVKKEMGRAE